MPLAYNPALVKRGRKLSERELQTIATIKRPIGRQLLTNDIVTGYQYERYMAMVANEWLAKHSK